MKDFHKYLALAYFKEVKNRYSISELMRILGFNNEQIYDLLSDLEANGYVQYIDNLLAITEKGLWLLKSKKQDTADVVEVVRCKDCQYVYFNSEAGLVKCCIFHTMTNPEGFCYLGERKQDA